MITDTEQKWAAHAFNTGQSQAGSGKKSARNTTFITRRKTFSKPLIGITASDRQDTMAYRCLWAAISLAGGQPLRLSPSEGYRAARRIDGLVLAGGKNVFPGLYDQLPRLDYAYDRERDDMELCWADKALSEKIPVLGICRGAQVMNIACGGSLSLGIAYAPESRVYPDGLIHNAFHRRDIYIRRGTLLRRITGRARLRVNSIRKPVYMTLGRNIMIDAEEADGAIQAIEHERLPFYLGLQFHPELMIYRRSCRNVFGAFVMAARLR